jgi:hypothetical protein
MHDDERRFLDEGALEIDRHSFLQNGLCPQPDTRTGRARFHPL